MDKKLSVNSLIECSNSGRNVRPAAIVNTVEKAMNSPLYYIYATNLEDNSVYDLIWSLLKHMKMRDKARTFGETMQSYWDCFHLRPFPSDLIMSLAFIGCTIKHKDKLNPFFRLPVIDYCKEAGRMDLYEKWFKEDDIAYRRDHHGRYPEICEVLNKCFNICGDAGEFIIPYNPDGEACLFKADYIIEPYRRRNEDSTDAPEDSLAATWVIILLMVLPMEYKRLEKNELYRSVTVQLKEDTKGARENGKEKKV